MTYPKSSSFAALLTLRHKEDIRAIGIVIFTFVLLYAHSISFGYDSAFMYLFWFFLNSTFCWYCATFAHNAIHVPIAKSKSINQIWQYLLCLIYGYPVTTLIPGHNLSHHAYCQGPKDTIRTDKMQWSWNFLNFLFFVPTLMTDITRQDIAYLDLMKQMKKPIYYQARREMIFLFISQAFLFNVLGSWRYFVVIFLPQLMAKFGLISINLFQHDGCPTPEKDKYNFSRNFVDYKLNWFTCNNGFHTAHHWQPGLHWTKLVDVHEKEIKPYMHPNLDCKSIIRFFFEVFLFGKRQNYDGTAYVKPFYEDSKDWFDSNKTYQTYSDSSKF